MKLPSWRVINTYFVGFMVTFKMCGLYDRPWLWVLAPLWVDFGLFLLTEIKKSFDK